MNELFNILKGFGSVLYNFAKDNWSTAAIFGAAGIYQNMFADGLKSLEDNILGKMGVNMGVDDFRPFGSVMYWDKIYKHIKNSNQQLGIASNLSKEIESAYKSTLPAAASIGASFEDIAKEYKSFVESTGRNRAFSPEELYDLIEVNQALGESAVNITANMSLLGVGINRAVSGMKALVVSSDKAGVNFKQVFKTLNDNVGLLYQLNFVNGVRGLEKMAKLAIQTKISMQSAAGVSENIFKGGLEGAVEMAANLQILGGEFATMGDAAQLFYNARNKPEELQKQIHDLTASVASFNRETGEITVSALGMDRLRQLSEITGISLNELSQSARVARKELDIEGLFDYELRGRGDFDDILTKVAGFAEFDTKINDWVVKLKDGAKSISQLSMGDIQSLTTINADNQEGVFREMIDSNATVSEKIQRLIDELKLVVLKETDYTRFDAAMTTMVDNFKQNIQTTWQPLVQMLQGMMSSSFNNMMTIIDKVNAGDMTGALTSMGNNMMNAVTSVGSVVWEGIKWLGSQLWAVAGWATGNYGLDNAIISNIQSEIDSLREQGNNARADELQRGLDEYKSKGYGFSWPENVMREIQNQVTTNTTFNQPTNPTLQVNPQTLQGNEEVLRNNASNGNITSNGEVRHKFDIPSEITVYGVDSSGNKSVTRKIDGEEYLKFLMGTDKPFQFPSTPFIDR